MAARDLLKPQSSVGSVAPISLPGVSVPTGPDPLLAVTQNMANSLSQRIGQMAQSAFKIAGTQAEVKGTSAGIQNAPSIEEIKWAKEHGQQVQLPGDAGSFNIEEQAAYASSLKLTESRYGSLAREAALAEVTTAFMSDGEMSPDLLQANLNSVLKEYTGALAGVSAAGAAKLDIDLRNQFNNQLVAYSREWHSKDTKARRAKAVADAYGATSHLAGIITGQTTVVDSGSVQDQFNAVRDANVEHMELEGVPTSTIEAYKTTWQKRQDNMVISTVTQWAQGESSGGPLQAWNKLRKGTAPDGIKDAFETLPTGKQTSLKNDLFEEHQKLESLEDDRQEAIDDGIKEIVEVQTANFLAANISGDRQEMRRIIGLMNKVDPDSAKALMPLLGKAGDAGTDDADTIRDLSIRIAQGPKGEDRTNIKADIIAAQASGALRSETAANLQRTLAGSRNHIFRAAESRLKAMVSFNVAMNRINPTIEDKAALRLYSNVMSKLHLASGDPEADLIGVVETEVAAEQSRVQAIMVEEARDALLTFPIFNTVEKVEQARATKATLNSKMMTEWKSADNHVQVIKKWGGGQ